MWETLEAFARDQLANNEFLSGGLIVVIFTGVMNYLRRVPMRIWRQAKRLSHTSMTLYNDKPIPFNQMLEWLGSQEKIMARNRNVQYHHHVSDGMMFGIGSSWFFHGWRLIRIWRTRDDSAMTGEVKTRENVIITCWGRSQGVLKGLMKEAETFAQRPVKLSFVRLYTPGGSGWNYAGYMLKRPMSATILKERQLESMVDRIKTFKSNRKAYAKLGVPHRLGFLLEGPPGTGKTSTIFTLASRFDADIKILSLSSAIMDDSKLFELCNSTDHDFRFIVFEDADTLFKQRKAKSKRSGVTFSGLLNAIDGLLSGTNQVVFITTNHVEKLDPALLRPGRVDVRMTIGNMDFEQGTRMYKRFFDDGGEISFAQQFEGQSAATAQEQLVRRYFGTNDFQNDELTTLETECILE